MSDSREKFISFVERMLFNEENVDAEVLDFFEDFKNGKVKNSSVITENGIKILKFLQENEGAVYTAKMIGERIELGSRTVSGSMRKLVTDGYVTKLGANPVTYQISEKGMNFNLDNIENLQYNIFRKLKIKEKIND